MVVSYRRSAIDDEDLTNLVLTPGSRARQSPQFVPRRDPSTESGCRAMREFDQA